MFKEYQQYDALGLAELIKAGDVDALEVLEAALHFANTLNPSLNAIIHRFDDKAKQQVPNLPKGIFHGVPFLFKDLTAVVKGEPMTMGSRGINWIPDYDSEHVKRIRQTGVSIFGKTNTPEFGLIITTEPKAHGATHNPHKLGYSSGGSSGGSASAVASGIVPMAGAGDGGGSIRFPAAWCGAFGLKPSRGLVPLGPYTGDAWSGAVADHVITRTVRDSAAMLDATAGAMLGSPFKVYKNESGYLKAAEQDPKPLRIAVAKKPLIEGAKIDTEVLSALEATAKTLSELGHHVEFVEPKIDTSRFGKDYFYAVCAHTAAFENDLKKQFGAKAIAKFEPATKNMAMIGRSIRADEFINAVEGWQLSRDAMGNLFADYDIMLCPTVTSTAEKHGVLPLSPAIERLLVFTNSTSFLGTGKAIVKSGMVETFSKDVMGKMAFTILGNVTGLPAMSVPLHTASNGLPIGMQFYGKMCDEAILLSLAGQLERGGFFKSEIPKVI